MYVYNVYIYVCDVCNWRLKSDDTCIWLAYIKIPLTDVKLQNWVVSAILSYPFSSIQILSMAVVKSVFYRAVELESLKFGRFHIIFLKTKYLN